MRSIESLGKKELIDLVSKCWMTHDGMWFYTCLQELGIEAANRLNKAAISSLAPIEISRFKKALGFGEQKIGTWAEFKEFFLGTTAMLIPDFMNVDWNFHRDKVLRWVFNEKKCFAYNGINRLGVIDKYECGPIYRVECWLKSLGIKYTVFPRTGKCVMPEKGACSGEFKITFDQ